MSLLSSFIITFNFFLDKKLFITLWKKKNYVSRYTWEHVNCSATVMKMRMQRCDNCSQFQNLKRKTTTVKIQPRDLPHVTSTKIKYFWNLKLLENYSVFNKFELEFFFPFMAIPNSEFDICNKLLWLLGRDLI